MDYDYKVIPFIGQSRGNLSAADVARQLESVIDQHATQGWEFYQLTDVNIEVQPGCIAGMFGAKVQYARFDQLIFRTSRTPPRVEQSGTFATEQHRNPASRAFEESAQSARPALPVTSKHLELWRQKTDEEVLSAANNLQDYTEEGQAVIRAELARRSLKFPEG